METVMTNSTVFTKDKETKTKVRYTIKNGAGLVVFDAITGSIYIDKDADLAVLDEIMLQIN